MVTKASARSKRYAPLSARLCFYYLGFAKSFLLILKKKSTTILNENVKLRRRICYSAKKRIENEEMIVAVNAIYAIT